MTTINRAKTSATDPGPDVFHHEFDDVEVLVERFDSDEREEWQMPERVINALDLHPAATVIEVGAGTGYFAVRLARHLPDGKLIAVDKQAKLVAYMQSRARRLGLTNLEAQLVAEKGGINASEGADLILSVDMYHHIPDRVLYFSNLIKHLMADGRVAIIDRKTNSPGSAEFNRVSPGAVKDEMRNAGFKPVADFDFLPHQYFLVFQVNREGSKIT